VSAARLSATAASDGSLLRSRCPFALRRCRRDPDGKAFDILPTKVPASRLPSFAEMADPAPPLRGAPEMVAGIIEDRCRIDLITASGALQRGLAPQRIRSAIRRVRR